jgi:hypothetical protein
MFLLPESTEIYGSCHVYTEDVQTHAIQSYFFVVRFEAYGGQDVDAVLLGCDAVWTRR